MKKLITETIAFLLAGSCFFITDLQARTPVQQTVSEKQTATTSADDTILVRKCADFTITGKGDSPDWAKAEWHIMTKLDSGGKAFMSRFKILYSPKGIYLLFNGEDGKMTTQADQEMGKIYEGDAYEAFFHPDPHTPVYFEYEINALNKELLLVISRMKKKSYAWAPWVYEMKRQQYKKVDLAGGKMEPGSLLKSWSAEIFFPYETFDLLPGNPPQSGNVWNANFCRMDYDSSQEGIKWSWSPTIGPTFHELEKFRSIRFE
jgi:hypothetical protein